MELCNQFYTLNSVPHPELTQEINTRKANSPTTKAPKRPEKGKKECLALEWATECAQSGSGFFSLRNYFNFKMLLSHHFHGCWDELLLPVPITAEVARAWACSHLLDVRGFIARAFRKQLLLSTEEKVFSYPFLFSFRNVWRGNVSLLVLWEWVVFAGRAVSSAQSREGDQEDSPHGSNSWDPNPGSATTLPYRNYFIFLSSYLWKSFHFWDCPHEVVQEGKLICHGIHYSHINVTFYI